MKNNTLPNIGLSESALQDVAGELKKLLAATYDLYYKTQACHWNVVNPQFHMFHKMFEGQYEALSEAVDAIAERMRILGYFPPMNLLQLVSESSLDAFPESMEASMMVKFLLEAHERIITELRKMVQKAESEGDEGTTDFFVERLKEHEKTAWMLRSGL